MGAICVKNEGRISLENSSGSSHYKSRSSLNNIQSKMGIFFLNKKDKT